VQEVSRGEQRALLSLRPKPAAASSRASDFIGQYPVVDLFAGPGGLGEGFASALDGANCRRFRSLVSIERDPFSYQTLLLRHFFRYFAEGEAPDDYYDFIAGRLTRDELFGRHPDAYAHANSSALCVSLGAETRADVRRTVRKRLSGETGWVLVGGPPCQAYSLAGRSRMMGRADFNEDERHTLYLEYLQIIADHRPPVFVMENVKGLLSATIDGKSAISRIVRDLSRPSLVIRGTPAELSYRLYSLSQEEAAEGDVDPKCPSSEHLAQSGARISGGLSSSGV